MTVRRKPKPTRLPATSIEYIAALRDSGMSAKARHVCMELASHGAERNDAGKWEWEPTGKWCSDLAAHTGMSPDSVSRAKREAIREGWIKRTHYGQGAGSAKVDTFDLSIPVSQTYPQDADSPEITNKTYPQDADSLPAGCGKPYPQDADTDRPGDRTIEGLRVDPTPGFDAVGHWTRAVKTAREKRLNPREIERREAELAKALGVVAQSPRDCARSA